jgi:hypothetical protein
MSPTPRARFKRHYLGMRPWTRHSLVLLVAGCVYICVGIVYLNTPEGSPTWTALEMAREWLPLNGWGTIWMIVGVLSILSARWPPRIETWGYMALTSLTAGWGAFYILGVIFGDNGFGSLAVGLMWFLVAFLWWAISGLISPELKGVVKNGRR